jgi:hypothetical protein
MAKRFPLTQWVLLNWLGVILGSFAAFFLYSSQGLARHSEIKDWFQLFRGMAICGAVQGLGFASLQAIALLQTTRVKLHKAMQLLFLTAIGMALGMALPIIYGLLTAPKYIENGSNYFLTSTIDYRVLGWILSWLLAGLFAGIFWGAIARRNPKQKITWGLLNAGAYSCWGIASLTGWVMLAAIFDYPPEVPLSEVLSAVGVIVAMLGFGSGLNSLIFFALLNPGMNLSHAETQRRRDEEG